MISDLSVKLEGIQVDDADKDAALTIVFQQLLGSLNTDADEPLETEGESAVRLLQIIFDISVEEFAAYRTRDENIITIIARITDQMGDDLMWNMQFGEDSDFNFENIFTVTQLIDANVADGDMVSDIIVSIGEGAIAPEQAGAIDKLLDQVGEWNVAAGDQGESGHQEESEYVFNMDEFHDEVFDDSQPNGTVTRVWWVPGRYVRRIENGGEVRFDSVEAYSHDDNVFSTVAYSGHLNTEQRLEFVRAYISANLD